MTKAVAVRLKSTKRLGAAGVEVPRATSDPSEVKLPVAAVHISKF